MTTEVALALFTAFTIIVQVLLQKQVLNQQSKSDKQTRYRAQLAEIKDAASQLIHLRYIQVLGDTTQNVPTVVAAYSQARTRLMSGVNRIKDKQLEDAVSAFLSDDMNYRDMANKHGLQSIYTSAAGGGLQLSYFSIWERCNELDPLK